MLRYIVCCAGRSLPPHPSEAVHDADAARELRGNDFIERGQHAGKTKEHQILDVEELDQGQGQTAWDTKPTASTWNGDFITLKRILVEKHVNSREIKYAKK